MGNQLVIVGGGPAGLTAGMYGARAGLAVVILEKGMPGGYVALSDLIENYPGFPEGIQGIKLAENMRRQAQRFGAKLVQADVQSIEKTNTTIRLHAHATTYEAQAVIIATGTVPRKLNIPGEDELRGRGVSYCATCDGPLFKGKRITVIGCGNSGLQEGRFLLAFAQQVTFVEILPHMTGDKILQDELQHKEHAHFLLNHRVTSINGTKRVESVTVKDQTTDEEKVIETDGIFVYIGLSPHSQFLKGMVQLDAEGFVIADDELQTSVPGIFAAGDIRTKEIRQVVTACSDGAQAALYAHRYIQSLH